MADLMLKDGPLETYRGWDIKLEKHDATWGETWGVPACFVGKLMAVKMPAGQGRPKFTIQPLWLSVGQMRKLRTDLDIESASMYLIELGLKAIKHSIDLYESGAMQPETLPAEPRALDPKTDLNDPQVRVRVEPGGLKIVPPTAPN